MTYAEKLRNPLWQKKRLQILERDKFTCTSCYHNDKTLHVHHLSYVHGKEPWEYDNDNFITLCEDCHKEVTEYYKVFQPQVITLIKKHLKDTFIQSCFLELLSACEGDEFNDLIFTLWELKSHKYSVIELLRAVSRIEGDATVSTALRFKPNILKSSEKCQESEQ